MLVMALLVLLGSGIQQAMALEAIVIKPEADVAELTTRGELYDNRGDTLQIETAAGLDGVTGRISVKASTPGTNPNWLVFALTNKSDKDMERWLTADRYTIVGSGAVWPDLDARRIEAVTPSIGFVPERIKSDRADVFRITLEPGQTITFVAELSSERFARVFLWKPIAYELKVRERLLLNGALLGLTGLLAVFLTAIFAANHRAIFPMAALVAWAVLGYLCVDFDLFHKLFNLRPEDNAVYRAAGEAAIAATLVSFLYAYLRLRFSHGLFRMLLAVWILAQWALVAVAVVDPRLASTFARLSFPLIGSVGAVITLYLALRNQDRAQALIPTWLMFLVWVFAAAVTLTGRLSGDVVVAGLSSGLVLVVVLIGFTVTQTAFSSVEAGYGAAPGEQGLRSLAVDGAGAATWEWNGRRDEIKVSPLIEAQLGLNGGELSAKVDDFATHLHPADRERFRLMLWSVQERAGGRIRVEFRLRHSDNSYRWYELEASSVESSDRHNVRCVGLLRDITDTKRAQERLLHDAVHCSLTGVPNRALFIDRLGVAVQRARLDGGARPTIMFIDLDKFKTINTSYGLVIGDSLLLTVVRRLQRHLGPQDTLARINGDQFAILLMSEQDPRELASLAERIRRSLRSPIKIAGQEIVLTGSLGIAIYDGEEESPQDLLKEAEIAMYRAKRGGADRIEIFRPEMRADPDDRAFIEAELRKAVEKGDLKVAYQPIVYLPTEELAGFEALARWTHPKLGDVPPSTFIPIAEDSDLINGIGSLVLQRATEDLAECQKLLPRTDSPLFVSVNVSSIQILKQDLVPEIRHAINRSGLPPGSLRLEITESVMMENPEKAVEVLEMLRAAGAELAIDDFGTGYSSLAYLQRFPVDTIKMDKAFMESTSAGEGSGAAIVRSIVALSHELGHKVVAEGIEYPEDVGFLRSINCEYGQGFYYGEAMPFADIKELVAVIAKTERRSDGPGIFKPKPKPKPKAASRKKAKRRKERQKATVVPAEAAANGHANGYFDPHADTGAPAADGPSPAMAAEFARPGPSGGPDLARLRESLPQSTVRPVPRPPVPPVPSAAPRPAGPTARGPVDPAGPAATAPPQPMPPPLHPPFANGAQNGAGPRPAPLNGGGQPSAGPAQPPGPPQSSPPPAPPAMTPLWAQPSQAVRSEPPSISPQLEGARQPPGRAEHPAGSHGDFAAAASLVAAALEAPATGQQQTPTAPLAQSLAAAFDAAPAGGEWPPREPARPDGLMQTLAAGATLPWHQHPATPPAPPPIPHTTPVAASPVQPVAQGPSQGAGLPIAATRPAAPPGLAPNPFSPTEPPRLPGQTEAASGSRAMPSSVQRSVQPAHPFGQPSEFKTLPPGIASSLAKLAGKSGVPRPNAPPRRRGTDDMVEPRDRPMPALSTPDKGNKE
ncbi:MAG: EAL domain-containing protein [Hyphomicrobiaceae bacterium]|nr:EAL domain-containing protein [Hyphomicrobiaceae bacterium]